jgi:hypothetical protein
MNREGARRDVLPLLHLRRVGLPKAGLPSPAREPRRELDRQRGATRKKEEEAGEEGSGGRGRRSSTAEELVVREAAVPAGRGSQLPATDAGR